MVLGINVRNVIDRINASGVWIAMKNFAITHTYRREESTLLK